MSFTDGADVTHTVTVSASSLYEAALGVAEFKRDGFAFISIGPATQLTISVERWPQRTNSLWESFKLGLTRMAKPRESRRRRLRCANFSVGD